MSSYFIYLYLLIWVVIFKCGIPKEILGNLCSTDPIMFGPVIKDYMDLNLLQRLLFPFNNPTSLDIVLIESLLNILIFIPFGIYLSIYNKKVNYMKCFIISLLFSASIEIFQLLTALGGFDYLDILTNVIGSLIGVYIYKKLINHYKERSNEIINKVNKFVIIIFLPICIFATIYTGINFKYIIFRLKHVKF